jgi:hypothetical protein
MESVRQKMEEVIQKQKRLQEQSQATTESGSASNKSQYILALGGVAAGLTIAVIVWLANSILTSDHIKMIAPERAEAIHTGEINRPSDSIDSIARLNERVERLTESVSSLEDKLTRVMVLTDSITSIEKNYVSSRQHVPEVADARASVDMNESNASSANYFTPGKNKVFVPTHTVKTRVNLRPAASLKTTPIAILKAGTEVEYIKETDGWYYVNTQLHGKGWCSSDYLSPLLPTQHKPSTK